VDTADHASDRETTELAEDIIRDTLQRPGVRKLVFSLVSDTIDRWSGKSRVRKGISRPIKSFISRLLQPYSAKKGNDHIPEQLARLITSYARDLNETRKKAPSSHAVEREQAINAFIQNTDFGEIREMVQGSEETILKGLDMTSTALYRYPAKIVSILAILVDIINISLKSIVLLIKPLMDNLGPDLTADIMLTSFRNIQGKEIGKIVGGMAEMIRRLHTGSLLLGKGCTPLFKVYLSDLLNDVISGIDPVVLQKARVALSEDRKSIQEAISDNLQENHDLLKSFIASYSEVRNPLIQAASYKTRMLEDLTPEELTHAVQEGLSGLDVQEAAEIVNSFTRLVNTIHEQSPELSYNIFKSFSDAIDPEEIRITMDWMVPELLDALKPLAYAFMPQLINALCELMTPSEGDETPEHLEAMQRLKQILATEARGDEND